MEIRPSFDSVLDLARPVRLERTTNRFEVCDSIRLSYGRVFRRLHNRGKMG